MWRIDDPQCNESSKIRWEIVPYTRGRGLDIGCGRFKAFNHFIGVDNGHHWGNEGIDVVSEATDLSTFASQSMDFVFSSHTLEHLEDTKKALKEWWRVIKPGGYLVLYLPHKNLYPNIGQRGANPDHKHDFLPEHICAIMETVGSWDLVENQIRDNDYGPGAKNNEYSFYQVYKKSSVKDFHKLSCLEANTGKKACVVRYGGFGDMIQTSGILPGLKRQGYHVTMMTTPKGKEILEHDPYIDEFIMQDTDQVPNAELGDYWDYWRNKFDKFVNLSMSVEGTLLLLPSDFRNNWPKKLIHEFVNKNYMELMADIADVPFEPEQRFYCDPQEDVWAFNELDSLQYKQVIVWSLSGSSIHKATPYVDSVIARTLMDFPDAHFILVGDKACQLLEGTSWEDEPRVWCRSGKYSIRQTLALAKLVDIVIGPETGVLNAVGLEDVHKIVLLSHSSEENLTKHWTNTISLKPTHAPCYPCHKMHYGWGTCPRKTITLMGDEVETVACVAELDQDVIYRALRDTLNDMEQAA